MELSRFLQDLIDRELPNLRALPEERALLPRGPGKWSPKEELGHLIDSASNNHLRFAGAAISGEYRGPTYAQEEWVRIHSYRRMPWQDIVAFWSQYNLFLVRLIAAIPASRLQAACLIASAPPVTLAWLIEDYVVHARHHIDLLLQREHVTPYPQ